MKVTILYRIKFLFYFFSLILSCESNSKIYNFFSSVKDSFEEDVLLSQIQEDGGIKKLLVEFNLRSLSVNEIHPELPKIESLHELNVKNLYLTKNRGEEQIPFYSVIVNQKVDDLVISIEEGKKIELPNISPTRFLPNKKVVKSRKKTEKLFYKTYYLGDFRGTHLTKIDIFPIHYERDSKELSIYPNLKLTFKGKGEVKEFRLNEKWNKASDGSEGFFVVTSPNLKNQVKDFINWKEKSGYIVDMFVTATNGLSKKEETTICKILKEKEIKYLLMIGIGGEVKSNFCINGKKGDDLIGDFIVGRLDVKNEDELGKYLKTIIFYEKGNTQDLFKNSNYRNYFYDLEKVLGTFKKKDIQDGLSFIENYPKSLSFYQRPKKEMEKFVFTPTILPTNRPISFSLIKAFLSDKLIKKYYFSGELFLMGIFDSILEESDFNSVKKIINDNILLMDPTLFLRPNLQKKLTINIVSNTLGIQNENGLGVSNARVVINGPSGQKIFYSDKKGKIETNFSILGKTALIFSPEYESVELPQ